MARKRVGLPAIQADVEKAKTGRRRKKEADQIINAPRPSLERLTEILAKAEAERIAEGLGPAEADPVIDAAWALSERAFQIAQQREAARLQADAGAIIVDRERYPDPADYLAALLTAEGRAVERIVDLRSRNAYLLGTVPEGE